MTKDKSPGIAALTREERLAAKLRENLRRRKSQAREVGGESDAETRKSDPSLSKPEGER